MLSFIWDDVGPDIFFACIAREIRERFPVVQTDTESRGVLLDCLYVLNGVLFQREMDTYLAKHDILPLVINMFRRIMQWDVTGTDTDSIDFRFMSWCCALGALE